MIALLGVAPVATDFVQELFKKLVYLRYEYTGSRVEHCQKTAADRLISEVHKL